MAYQSRAIKLKYAKNLLKVRAFVSFATTFESTVKNEFTSIDSECSPLAVRHCKECRHHVRQVTHLHPPY